ncbi:uncharacterized protein DSM5745_07313 [Aspergillus mulundensis]|uniref:Uncharacterized protein n=1 Tax=Aspergillus mulundensis TaxID=1810919 RepID=A0A3D8RLH2_9EURO|nr:hypothetical protein DSM5745_07313 [Aspergillus mulundensis]RDW74651.1 hypothetical protein DSM5745_07313 [Aspergillus mulundensis]
MKPPIFYLSLFFTASLASSPDTQPAPLQNANHIFNAIHASMRQFGSSLHHNGMSFFLASVPKDTKLYHGNASPDLLKGIGWMAFEPEHAMVFARPSRRHQERMDSVQDQSGQQVPMTADEGEDEPEPPADVNGYLHTYTTAKDLRLVYIDGTSAGKSRIGTLDSQDRIMFNDTISGGVSGEDQRAKTVCQLAKNEWQGRIDGVIRMAAGFEIILCDPEANLTPVRVMPVEKRSKDRKLSAKDDKGKEREGKPRGKPAELLRAITSRFNGIGGNRVKVNYDNFVTAFNPIYELDLFPDNAAEIETGKGPRLQHLPPESLEPIRENLTSLVLEHKVTESNINWQSIADLIVDKYGPLLRGLLGRGARNHHSMRAEEDESNDPDKHWDDKTGKHKRMAKQGSGRKYERRGNGEGKAQSKTHHGTEAEAQDEHEHDHEPKTKAKHHSKNKTESKDEDKHDGKAKAKAEGKDEGKHKPRVKHHMKRKHQEHGNTGTGSSAAAQIASILLPFTSSSPAETTTLCATQFLSPPSPTSPLAQKALYSISSTICSTLVELHSFLLQLDDEEEEEGTKLVHATITDLMAYLDWTGWKECRGCRGDEFCAVPIWPSGGVMDFERPRCERFEDGWRGEGYWGGVWG